MPDFGGHRKRPRRHRRRPEGRRPRAAEGIRRQGQATATLGVGDEVEVYLERVENALGEAVLSREKARREESWVRLEEKFEAGEAVDRQIFNQVKGGFTVDLDGAVAFLPRSQVDIRPVRDVTPLMHTPQPFQILKMDKRRGNIVVSRRAVLEESRAEQRSELVQNLEEGQVPSKAWSRTSPTTVRSSTSAASTACCTSPTSRGAASTTRRKSCPSARPSRSRSSDQPGNAPHRSA
jgi:hypothetical protein